MAKIVGGVRYADGAEPRTTTAGPGVPSSSWRAEMEARVAALEAAVGQADEGGEPSDEEAAGDEPTADAAPAEAEEPTAAAAPAKRPTSRKVETK